MARVTPSEQREEVTQPVVYLAHRCSVDRSDLAELKFSVGQHYLPDSAHLLSCHEHVGEALEHRGGRSEPGPPPCITSHVRLTLGYLRDAGSSRWRSMYGSTLEPSPIDSAAITPSEPS